MPDSPPLEIDVPVWLSFLLISASSAVEAPRLLFALEDRALTISHAASTVRYELAEDCSAEGWESFVDDLADGRWTAQAAREWGDRLFPAASHELLASALHWQVEGVHMAGLDAVVPPWSDGDALIATTRLDFDPRSVDQRELTISSVLALIPFVTDRFDALDAPDTLRAAWAAGLRDLRLMPRNDVDPRILRELLESESRALIALRAKAETPRGWAQQWDAAAPLRLWCWPGRAAGCDAEKFAQQCAALSAGAAALCADRWPLAESLRAGDQLALLHALREGRELGDALYDRKRELQARGLDPRRWAGWIVSGDASLRVSVEAPNWWQRWLRTRHAKTLAVEIP